MTPYTSTSDPYEIPPERPAVPWLHHFTGSALLTQEVRCPLCDGLSSVVLDQNAKCRCGAMLVRLTAAEAGDRWIDLEPAEGQVCWVLRLPSDREALNMLGWSCEREFSRTGYAEDKRRVALAVFILDAVLERLAAMGEP